MRKIALALAAIAAYASPAPAGVVYSNNFNSENGGRGALNYNRFSGLTVSGGTVDLNASGDYGTVCDGSCVDLDGSSNNGGAISSAFYSFNAGDQVTLSFLLGGNQRRNDAGGDALSDFGFIFSTGTALADFGIDLGGGPVSFGPTNALAGNFTFGDVVRFDSPFSFRSAFFTAAQAGSVALLIGTDSADNIGPFIDDVTLDVTSAVPEPATWAMMIGGVGFVGGALRRRRATPALA